MEVLNIVRAAIPDADESLCEYVIWGRTPYPCSPLTAKDVYRAALRSNK